jgi:hypothetical protein
MGGVTVGDLELPAPHGITEEAAPLTIDESAVQPAVAALGRTSGASIAREIRWWR